MSLSIYYGQLFFSKDPYYGQVKASQTILNELTRWISSQIYKINVIIRRNISAKVNLTCESNPFI